MPHSFLKGHLKCDHFRNKEKKNTNTVLCTYHSIVFSYITKRLNESMERDREKN